MRKITFRPVLTAAAAVVVLSACIMMSKHEQSQVAATDTFKYDTVDDGIRAAELSWQDYFVDPRLHRLIDIASERSAGSRTTALSVEIYRKQYMIARNNLLPTVSASGTGSCQDSLNSGGVNSQYSMGLDATLYGLSLLGRVRSTSEAALQGYLSVAANRDVAHLTLISTVTKAYFNERYTEETMALTQCVLQTRETAYRPSQSCHKAGATSTVDSYRREVLTESVKTDYASAVENREQARDFLVMLINQPLPEDLPVGLSLNKQFETTKLSVGLSSDPLLNHLDICATEHAFKQANASIGTARAVFFLRVSLTGSVSTVPGELSDLLKGGMGVWAPAPSITPSIFD